MEAKRLGPQRDALKEDTQEFCKYRTKLFKPVLPLASPIPFYVAEPAPLITTATACHVHTPPCEEIKDEFQLFVEVTCILKSRFLKYKKQVTFSSHAKQVVLILRLIPHIQYAHKGSYTNMCMLLASIHDKPHHRMIPNNGESTLLVNITCNMCNAQHKELSRQITAITC